MHARSPPGRTWTATASAAPASTRCLRVDEVPCRNLRDQGFQKLQAILVSTFVTIVVVLPEIHHFFVLLSVTVDVAMRSR